MSSEEDTQNEFSISKEDNISSVESAIIQPSSPQQTLKDGELYITSQPSVTKVKRRKRSVVVSDRKVRSADVGVSGLYEV